MMTTTCITTTPATITTTTTITSITVVLLPWVTAAAGEAGRPEWPSPQRESILAKARSRVLERRIALGQLECWSTLAAERRVRGMTER